ncbi:MAG: mercury(II) reductase [Parcubacteria group bacterium]|nr:mercury(II) reductase [Parcubacteria group bacterium]
MKQFDLIIIGGGAAGFAAAIRANELGAKTAMVNDGLPLGGTCVNVGCVPSKTLIHAANLLHETRNHGVPGIELSIKNSDFAKVVQDELALVERLREEKYSKVLASLGNVTFIEGRARFRSEHEIEVNGKTLSASKFIIATGSTAMVPPIEGIREAGSITHIEALRLEKQPRELIVIGAGPVGLEFAQMFARFGTKVTILQRDSTIFRGEKELIDRLTEILTKEGITIVTNVEVLRVRPEEGKKLVTYRVEGKEETARADEILLAAGKTPNTEDLGLEKVDVKVNDHKAVEVDQYFKTRNPAIFAVGDAANLPLRLEITAGHEGTLAAENALTGSQKSIDYAAVPYTVFTDPELAGVGFTEDEQIKKLGVCACRTVSFADVPRAIIMRRTEGLIKMAIHPKTRQIVGVHILAPHAGELIAEAMMLVKNKNTIDDVIESLPMFPTLSEGIKLAALSFTKDISKLSCCI